MTQQRTRDMLRPWWRPIATWAAMMLIYAVGYTFIPDLDRGWSFVEELRYAAILAAIIQVLLVVTNASLDWRDRRRETRDKRLT